MRMMAGMRTESNGVITITIDQSKPDNIQTDSVDPADKAAAAQLITTIGLGDGKFKVDRFTREDQQPGSASPKPAALPTTTAASDFAARMIAQAEADHPSAGCVPVTKTAAH